MRVAVVRVGHEGVRRGGESDFQRDVGLGAGHAADVLARRAQAMVEGAGRGSGAGEVEWDFEGGRKRTRDVGEERCLCEGQRVDGRGSRRKFADTVTLTAGRASHS